MTNEELVQQIQAGNADLLPELWEGVRHFVWQQAYRWARAWAQNDSPSTINDLANDLYQEGYLAVVAAAKRFEADRGALFLTCLGFYLKRHFKRTIAECAGWTPGTLERASKAIYIESLNRPILNEGSDDAIELGDTIADPTDFVEDLTERMYLDSLHNDLDKLLNQLDPDKAQAIRLHFYKNMTYEQAGQIMGVTGDGARWRISTGMRELRRLNMREKRLEAYIDRNTDFYHHIGVTAFQNTGMSSVEWACLKRMELRRKGLYHDEI